MWCTQDPSQQLGSLLLKHSYYKDLFISFFSLLSLCSPSYNFTHSSSVGFRCNSVQWVKKKIRFFFFFFNSLWSLRAKSRKGAFPLNAMLIRVSLKPLSLAGVFPCMAGWYLHWVRASILFGSTLFRGNSILQFAEQSLQHIPRATYLNVTAKYCPTPRLLWDSWWLKCSSQQ